MKDIYVEPFLYDIPDAVKLAKKYNLGLEIYLIADKIDQFSEIGAPKDLLNINKLSVHGPIHDISYGSSDRLIREASVQRLKKSLSFVTKNLEAKWFLTHMGLNPFTYWSEKMVLDWIKRASILLNQVLSEFPQIIIHVENAYETDPMHIKKFVEALDHNKIFVTLDIGHVNVYSNISPEEWIKTLAPYIKEVHVHNNDGNFDAHLPLRDGIIDYNKIFKLIDDEVGEYIITLEPINEENLVMDLKWLEERGYK